MRIAMLRTAPLGRDSVRVVDSTALDDKRLRGPYVGLSKKARLMECAPGIYDRFDFTEPFSSLKDFLSVVLYADMENMPYEFSVRCGETDVAISGMLHSLGRLTSSGYTESSSVGSSGAMLKIFDSITVDTSDVVFSYGGIFVTKSLNISGGRTLRFRVGRNVEQDEIPVTDVVKISTTACGVGGASAGSLSSPGTLMGKGGSGGSSGNSLGTGGGGSGSAYSETSGIEISSVGGGDGTAWRGGVGGSGVYSVSDHYLYGGARVGWSNSCDGAPTVIIYAESVNNLGTIHSGPSYTQTMGYASSGGGGGGCVVLLSPSIQNPGTLSTAGCSASSLTGVTKVGSAPGGRGSTKVVPV